MTKISDHDPILAFDYNSYFSETLRCGIFWMVYSLLHLSLFVFGWIKQRDDLSLKILNQIGTSIYISRAAGLVLSFDCAILLLPTCRNLIRLIRSPFINRWIPFDDNIFLHKVTAYYLLLFTVIHVNAHYWNFFLVHVYIYLRFRFRKKYHNYKLKLGNCITKLGLG